MPFPESASAINCFHPQPFFPVQKKTNPRLPSGRKLFDTMKSSRSMMVEPAPRGCTPDKMLKPRTHGILSIVIRNAFNRTLFLRDQCNRSIQNAMIFSNTAMTVVKAAKLRKTKNRAPQIRPPRICANRLGMVIKIRPGPESGSTP